MARETRNNDRPRIPEYKIEGARIGFRNFQGKKTEFNEAGNRNFALFVPEEDVETLLSYGWNVKRTKPRDEAPDGNPYIPVKVKYGAYPPIAVLITSRGKTRLDEETIDQLDWARIKNVDVVIRPYQYGPTAVKPEGGVAAYLKGIWVTIQEDEFDQKYADIPWADDDPESEEMPYSE